MNPKKYTELAKIAPQCFGCRQTPQDGELVLAHRNLNGWGMLFGRGIKSLSLAGAILCGSCHRYGDNEGRNDSEFWEMAVQRTLTWSFESGFLQFNSEGGDESKALR